MPFSIGTAVWFKKANQTPFHNSTLLGGSGSATISQGTKAGSGLRDEQGVPTFDFSSLPTPLDANDPATGTFPATGEKLGVREQVTVDPLAPSTVSTSGKFDNPTSAAAYNPGLGPDGSPIDEGNVDVGNKNTIRTDDPNVMGGMTVASGYSNPSGSHELATEQIDLKTPANRYGRRTPSTTAAPGIVIEEYAVKEKSVTPDGTVVYPGELMYAVDWGVRNPSNPHSAKWYNRFRVSIHAEKDLIAA